MTAHDLACVVHVHSTYSDGTATVPEILTAARGAEVDAVLLTDHDTQGAREDGWEGWHNGVLLLVGHEVSPKAGHFLAFGLDGVLAHDGRSEREIADEVAARGGLGFPAHPFSEGSALSRRIAPPHGWGDLDDAPIAGVEVWSLLTDAAERAGSVRELAAFLRAPEEAMDHPFPRALEAWDRLAQRRRVVGIGGLDAHQSGFRVLGRPLSPLPHARVFRTLRTHVLLAAAPSGRLEPDRAAVYAALREGRCYLAMDGLADARGFDWWAESDAGERVQMGGEAGGGGWTLHARLPQPALLRVIRAGEEVARGEGAELAHRAEGPGPYRLEARLERHGRERTWVLSNPVYLRA